MGLRREWEWLQPDARTGLLEYRRILKKPEALLGCKVNLLTPESLNSPKGAHRRMRPELTRLGRRIGEGHEETVRAAIKEFTGVHPLRVERVVIRDDAGELYGVRGLDVELDIFVGDGRRFLVEWRIYAEPEDVLNFFRKVQFARAHLKEPFEPLLMAPFTLKRAAQLAQELGIRVLMYGDEDALEGP